MQGATECEGQIRLSSLPWEVSERLAQFHGNWLEYIPKTNSIGLRGVQAVGCPVLTGVACELITLIDSLPADCRDSMPGGELSIRDSRGPLLRLLVCQGEVRIKWPNRPCTQSVPVFFESTTVAEGVGGVRITGWARFAGSPAKTEEIKSFVQRFGGLFPSEDMPSECVQNTAYIRLKNADLNVPELLDRLQALSDPPESLEADLEVVPEGAGLAERGVRIRIAEGRIESTGPALRT